jgi:hypothetical protein
MLLPAGHAVPVRHPTIRSATFDLLQGMEAHQSPRLTLSSLLAARLAALMRCSLLLRNIIFQRIKVCIGHKTAFLVFGSAASTLLGSNRRHLQ